MIYYDDIDPNIIEQGSSYDQFILGFGCGVLLMLLITKYIFRE